MPAVVAAALVLLLLGAVRLRRRSDDTPDAAATPAEGVGTVTVAADGVQEITLQTQDDYVFTPDHFTVDPGTVRLTVVNVAEQLTHNFRFTPDAGPEAIDAVDPAARARAGGDHRVRRRGPRRPSLRVQLPHPAGAGRHDDGPGLIVRCPSSTWC